MAAKVAVGKPNSSGGTLKRLEHQIVFLGAGTLYKMGEGALTCITLALRKTTNLELVVRLDPWRSSGTWGW